MCILEVQPTEVHLKGISRTTSFTIRNPNEFLAASYALDFSEHSVLSSSKLSLFPEKGILLCGQSQKIKIKYTGGSAESSLGQFYEEIVVTYTFRIQYNRSLMMKKSMKGWQRIPEAIQKAKVTVLVGGEKEAIQKFIKEDIIFNQEFNKDGLELSAIHESAHRSFINEKSFQNLEIDSFAKSTGFNQIASIGHDKKSQKTGLQLPIQEICPLQYGQSRAGNANSSRQERNSSGQSLQQRKGVMRYPMVESKIMEDVNKSFQVSMKTVQNEFSDQSGFSSRCTVNSNNRSSEFVILAIIAAFFVALGNNLGRFLR